MASRALLTDSTSAEGHTEGHTKGHTEGHTKGHTKGHTEGQHYAVESEKRRLNASEEVLGQPCNGALTQRARVTGPLSQRTKIECKAQIELGR
jgi:flagellar biosynthesis/type III secretory pathway protein FliH